MSHFASFRKLDVEGRRQRIAEACDGIASDLAFGATDEVLSLADTVVEHAYGAIPVAVGLATGFLIDGVSYDVPMASEEPSVIAAASYAATRIARAGGFTTGIGPSHIDTFVYICGAREGAESFVLDHAEQLRDLAQPILQSMTKRGGGWVNLGCKLVAMNSQTLLRVGISLNVVDAQGANLSNSVAEILAPRLEEISGGQVLMAILSNHCRERVAWARCSIPYAELAPRGNYEKRELASRIALATELAFADPDRAVTHNKGIMNGVSALALATANDGRAIEAAAHFEAAKGGYHPLSRWYIDGANLVGEIRLPSPFATRGGTTGVHPSARASLRILGNPDAATLGRVAAAVGLAQNFAALSALVGEGIQSGHMKLHMKKSPQSKDSGIAP